MPYITAAKLFGEVPVMDEVRGEIAKASIKTKEVMREEFITISPLYVKVELDFYPPGSISFYCWHKKCAKETTWFRAYEATTLGKGAEEGKIADHSISSCAYKCFKCSDSVLTVVYKTTRVQKEIAKPPEVSGPMPNVTRAPRPPSALPNNNPPAGTLSAIEYVMKIGQFPEPSVDLPSGLEENLGKEASKFYRRALICRNNGFGLGAATYIRRVVEDKTNELIELAAQYAESYEMDEATIKAIRKAGDSAMYTTYEEKLKYASGVFPRSLKVKSYNPLATLYGLVSGAIHSLSEEECIVIADQTPLFSTICLASYALTWQTELNLKS